MDITRTFNLIFVLPVQKILTVRIRFPNNILNGKFNGKSSIKNLKKDLKMINLILKKSKSKKYYTELSNEILSNIDDIFNMKDFTHIYKMWDKI